MLESPATTSVPAPPRRDAAAGGGDTSKAATGSGRDAAKRDCDGETPTESGRDGAERDWDGETPTESGWDGADIDCDGETPTESWWDGADIDCNGDTPMESGGRKEASDGTASSKGSKRRQEGGTIASDSTDASSPSLDQTWASGGFQPSSKDRGIKEERGSDLRGEEEAAGPWLARAEMGL